MTDKSAPGADLNTGTEPLFDEEMFGSDQDAQMYADPSSDGFSDSTGDPELDRMLADANQDTNLDRLIDSFQDSVDDVFDTDINDLMKDLHHMDAADEAGFPALDDDLQDIAGGFPELPTENIMEDELTGSPEFAGGSALETFDAAGALADEEFMGGAPEAADYLSADAGEEEFGNLHEAFAEAEPSPEFVGGEEPAPQSWDLPEAAGDEGQAPAYPTLDPGEFVGDPSELEAGLFSPDQQDPGEPEYEAAMDRDMQALFDGRAAATSEADAAAMMSSFQPAEAPSAGLPPASTEASTAAGWTGWGVGVLGLLLAAAGGTGYMVASGLNDQIQAVRSDVKALSADRTGGDASEKMLQQLFDDVGELRASVGDLSLAAAKGQDKALEERISKLEATLEKEVDGLRRQMEGMDGRLNGVQRGTAPATTPATAAPTSMAPDRETKAKLEQLEKALAEVREMASRLETRVADVDRKATALASAPRAVESPRPPETAARPTEGPAVVIAPPAAPPKAAAEPKPAATGAEATPPRTTPAPAKRVAPSGGSWGINVLSFDSRSAAEKQKSRMEKAGPGLIIREAAVEGRTWYRLRLEGFANANEAKGYLSENRSNPDLRSAWVSRNP